MNTTQRQSRNMPIVRLAETNSYSNILTGGNIFDQTSPIGELALKTCESEATSLIKKDKSPLTLKRFTHMFSKK
jgi:membrane peptidoglycan carboxypeptidase